MTINARNPQVDEQLLREYLTHKQIPVEQYQQFDPWSKIETMRACVDWGNQGKPKNEQPPAASFSLPDLSPPATVDVSKLTSEDQKLEAYLRHFYDAGFERYDAMPSYEKVNAFRAALAWAAAGYPVDQFEMQKFKV